MKALKRAASIGVSPVSVATAWRVVCAFVPSPGSGWGFFYGRAVLGWLRSREGAGYLCTSLGPELERVVPARYKRHAHHWLILHGRYVCKARKPDCPACVVRDLCGYKAKTAPSRSNNSPKQPRRAAATVSGAPYRASRSSK